MSPYIYALSAGRPPSYTSRSPRLDPSVGHKLNFSEAICVTRKSNSYQRFNIFNLLYFTLIFPDSEKRDAFLHPVYFGYFYSPLLTNEHFRPRALFESHSLLHFTIFCLSCVSPFSRLLRQAGVTVAVF